jgi:hypothetical protein
MAQNSLVGKEPLIFEASSSSLWGRIQGLAALMHCGL